MNWYPPGALYRKKGTSRAKGRRIECSGQGLGFCFCDRPAGGGPRRSARQREVKIVTPGLEIASATSLGTLKEQVLTALLMTSSSQAGQTPITSIRAIKGVIMTISRKFISLRCPTQRSLIGFFFTGAYILASKWCCMGRSTTRWVGHLSEIYSREMVVITPLMALMLVIGVWPAWLFERYQQVRSACCLTEGCSGCNFQS